MSTAFIELKAENLDAVLASARTRGLYRQTVEEFLALGVSGVQISLTDGPFKGKKANSAKQSFAALAAKDEYKDRLRVVESDGQVYLINKEVA